MVRLDAMQRATSLGKVIWLSGLTLVVMAPISCVSTSPVTGQCRFNRDCNPGLICANEQCRQVCATPRDCPAGHECRPGSQPGSTVCLPTSVTMYNCNYSSECPVGLVCGPRGICQPQCNTDIDCLVMGWDAYCDRTQDAGQGVCKQKTPVMDGGIDTGPPMNDAGQLDASDDSNAGTSDVASDATGPSDCGFLPPLGGGITLANGAVTLPSNTALNFGSGNFTIEMWIRATQLPGAGGAYLYHNRGLAGACNSPFLYFYLGSGLELGSGIAPGNCFFPTSPPIRLDVWEHVAMERNGTTLIYFINGVPTTFAGAIGATVTTNSGAAIQLGTWAGRVDSALFGEMDEVRVWNVARTEAQIVQNMRTTLRGDEPGLVGYFKFDEASGNVVTDSVVGNTLTGTLSAGVLRTTGASPPNTPCP